MATWLTQRGKDGQPRTLPAVRRTEDKSYYKQFIGGFEYIVRLLCIDNSEVSALVNLYTLIGRMRISSMMQSLGKGRPAARMLNRYLFLDQNKTFTEIETGEGQSLDGPRLREFGEVLRKELIVLK